jgi:hypothetical protein
MPLRRKKVSDADRLWAELYMEMIRRKNERAAEQWHAEILRDLAKHEREHGSQGPESGAIA